MVISVTVTVNLNHIGTMYHVLVTIANDTLPKSVICNSSAR